MSQNKTLLHHLLKLKDLNPSWIAVKVKKNNQWKNYHWKDYFEIVEKIGNAFLSLGIRKGDKISLMSQTRPEWSYFDFGIMGVGGITIPIYPNCISNEVEFILRESESKVLIVENRMQFKKWTQISDRCPSVRMIISIEEFEGEEKKDYEENEEKIRENLSINSNSSSLSFLSLSSLLEVGKSYKGKHIHQFSKACKESQLDDLASIIYTSGTTGFPKGVVLTHNQILSEVSESYGSMPLSEKDTFLSFLPFAHVFGRLESLGHIYKNPTLAYAEGIETLASNLVEIKPTVLMSVPRIFEKVYNGILLKVEAHPLKLKLFHWALKTGKKISFYKKEKKSPPFLLKLKYFIAHKLVFSKLHQKLGGRLKMAISGGASLDYSIIEFFHASGLLVLEGYGLTETTGAVCVNRPSDFEFGTVGKPIGEVKIKLDKDGEILIKSNKVMKEYYKNKEATKNVFDDDGYFRSGDIGEWTERGFLKITDRKKDLIKTSGGKYISPQKLENLLKLNKYISYVLIHGERRKFVVALITLDEVALENFAKEKNIQYEKLQDLTKNKDVYALIEKAVSLVNGPLARYERIKKFSILPKNFSIEDGELTPSLKIKRKFCDKKYNEILETLYGEDRGQI